MPPDHPMVQYLNSLRTQDSTANPSYVEESRRPFLAHLRQQAPWFPQDDQLRVPTQLDALVDALISPSPSVDIVVLTGDAGDGKTAVCMQLWGKLSPKTELLPIDRAGGWVLVKDASEVDEQELRSLFLEHLQRQSTDRLLVAINEGRLRRLLRPESFAGPERQLVAPLWRDIIGPSLEALNDEARAAALDEAMRRERVAIVNFRHRMHVDTVTGPLLDRWTVPDAWEQSEVCGACPAVSRCPILANVADLRSAGAQRRMIEVLGRTHHAGQRIPFRRLQGVLALAATGGLRCADVRPVGALAREELSPIARLQHRWYQVLWSHAAPVSFRPEPVTSALPATDPGKETSLELDQTIDGLLAAQDEPRLGSRPLGPLEREAVVYARQLFGDASRSARPTEELSALTRALRRWHAMVGDGSDPTWSRSLALLRAYATTGEEGALRAKIVEALNRLHRLDAVKTNTISSRQLDPMAFRRHERHTLEFDLGVEFAVRLRRGPLMPELIAGWLEGRASEIELLAWPVGSSDSHAASLRIDAPLLEALLGICDGFSFAAALGPYRRDLARFHACLVALAVEAGHTPQVLVRADGVTYRVQSDGKKLRFEGV